MKTCAVSLLLWFTVLFGQTDQNIQLKWTSSFPEVDSVNTYLTADSKNTAVDNEGNLYLLTSFISEDFPYNRFKLAKYNSSGIFLWQVESNDIELKNFSADLIELDHFDYIVIAVHSIENDFPKGLFLMKFNPAGILQWEKEFNDSLQNSFSIPIDMVFDSQNNIILSGYSGRIENNSMKNDSLLIMKCNSLGTLKWTAETGNDSLTRTVRCKLDDSDNVFVSGEGSILSHSIKMVKFGSNGSRIWSSSYTDNKYYFTSSDIASDKNYNYFVTGNASTLNFNSKWITIKFDKNGNRKWVSFEDKDSSSDSYETSVLINTDENGFSNVIGYENKNNISNYFSIRYDTAGLKISDKIYSDTTKEYIQRVALDNNGNLITAGYFQDPNNIYLIKFDNNGNKLWAKSFSSGGIKKEDNGMNLVLNNSGSIYLTSEDSSRKSNVHEVISTLYNSSGKEIWTIRSNEFLKHQAASMVNDNNGNTYLTGWIENGKGDNKDFITIKFDSSGKSMWMSRYDGPGHSNDIPNSISLDPDGNVYVCGSSTGINSGMDFITIKYNLSGIEEWEMRYNGPGNDTDLAASTAIDKDGNIYTGGSSIGAAGNYDFAVIKYNKYGQLKWIRRFDDLNGGKDSLVSIAADDAGNVYAAGTSDSTSSLYNFLALKYSPSGDLIWVSRYSEPGDKWEKAKRMVLDKENNLYIIGESYRNSTKEDLTTVKFNSGGIFQWAAKWDDASNLSDFISDIKVNKKEDVYITGYGPGSGTGDDYVTVKYDSLGNQQWAVTYNDPQNFDNVAAGLALDYQENAYIIGVALNSSTYSLVKYDSNGIMLWDENYGYSLSADAASIGINVDDRGNIILGGYNGNNYWSVLNLMKFSQPGFIPTGIVKNVKEKFQYGLSQNFPNPFNPSTIIKYSIPRNSFVTIKLYDILGREIKTLLSKQVPAGYHEFKFDGSNLSSGIYFYSLSASALSGKISNFIDTKKMIILK